MNYIFSNVNKNESTIIYGPIKSNINITEIDLKHIYHSGTYPSIEKVEIISKDKNN
jgi:hypothetical protein